MNYVIVVRESLDTGFENGTYYNGNGWNGSCPNRSPRLDNAKRYEKRIHAEREADFYFVAGFWEVREVAK